MAEANDLVQSVLISDEELASLTQAIFKRHGIDFTCYETKSLKRRVMRTMSVFKFLSIHELWVRILKDQPFIYSFMDEISVGLTSMFRDPVLWKRMKELLKKDLAGKDHLQLWHAGCSSGEELYTMGIVLKESGFDTRVNAWATDISKQSIENAQRGEYHHIKVEEYERNYKAYNPFGSLKNHYEMFEGGLRMHAALRDHVTFDYHNLITGDFSRKFDVIFCRNVMIYFDNNAKLKLFEKFHNSLNPGGMLIIGFYDAVMPLVDEKKFKVMDMDARIFIKV